MDKVGQLSTGDRADLFLASAARRRIAAAIIEKDFWVCWTLRRLFTLPKPPAHLLFKGGTSLSKVYNAIERFSEDIDLSFNRGDLGFSGEADPSAATGKKRRHALDRLREVCQKIIQEELLPLLEQSFAEALSSAPGEKWSVTLAEDDPDRQTILFKYPSGIESGFSYVRPIVRLEFGARSDHWPAVDAKISSYAAQDFPDAFSDAECMVRALSAERTFWEKATVLHAWHHAPAEKVLRDRQSRHYYDVVRLYENGLGKTAMKDTGLLEQVAKHKTVFYAAGWARYHEARPGTLRLVPSALRLEELRRDYESMREMFFAAPPSFDHLLAVLMEIETGINRLKA
jgi:hypothetical protein